MTPGNPQRCNSMIATRSIQLYLYMGWFTLGVLALVNTVFEKLPKVNHVYGLLLLDYETLLVCVKALVSKVLYLLFTNWVQGPYQEIQAQGFSYSPSLRGLFGKPRACISWYGTSTQLVNSLLHDPF